MVLPLENITELYRFALLLTGSAETAGEVLTGAIVRMPQDVLQMRGEKSRTVWLMRKIREMVVIGASATVITKPGGGDWKNESELPIAPARELPPALRRLSRLPEPERTALALFYTDLLGVREIALALDVPLENLSDILGHARELLEAIA